MLKYFAYGSNMHLGEIKKYCPSAQILGPAKLDNYRLAFSRKSKKNDSGIADIIPAKGLAIWGILYELKENEIRNLDKKENIGRAYKKIFVNVKYKFSEKERTMNNVITYSVISKSTVEIKPNKEYLDIIIKGARQNNLNKHYIKFLESLKSIQNRWTNNAIYVFPSSDREKAKGMNLLRISKFIKNKFKLKTHAAVTNGEYSCIVKIVVDKRLNKKKCRLDQTVRRLLFTPTKSCYGNTIEIAPIRLKKISFPFVNTRTISLRLSSPSIFYSEKKVCVLHKDYLKLLGINEGDYVKIYSVIKKSNGEYEVKNISLRVYSPSQRRLKRKRGKKFPSTKNIYIDFDGRSSLGISKNIHNYPLVIAPNVWRFFSGRMLYYGTSLFIGFFALISIIEKIKGLNNLEKISLSIGIPLILSAIFCIFDVRGKLQY